jgi:hypothetical protein
MRYTQDVAEFVRYNHSEVSRLVTSICASFDFTSHTDDVIQNLYLKFLTRRTLERFNPEFNGGTKISTYLHSVIVNMVKAMCSEKENKIERHRYKFQYIDSQKQRYREDPCYDEIEMAINTEGMDIDYEGNLYANYSIESVDGIDLDLNLFEVYLKKMNRTFKLSRRRCKNVRSKGLSLLDVFMYMRKGYNHRAIARKYGVSVTFITSLKTEIKWLMIKYGFVYGISGHQNISGHR